MIIVTGAAGFIGAHVAKALLDRGDRVIGIDNLNPYYSPQLKQARLAELVGHRPEFRFVQADFADRAALAAAIDGADVGAIVHLGAQAGVRHSIEAPRDYGHSNLVGQLELLECARQAAVRHFVYASSSSVYGEAQRLPLSVDDRADRPVSLYAATKRAGELMAESYSHLYHLPATGLRFFTVYGPWGRPDMAIWQFTKQILNNERISLYNRGEMQRDFTFVDDIVAGVLAALDRPPADDGAAKPGGSTNPHAIYNLGNDRPEGLREMVALIGDACGRVPQIELAPMQPGDVTATWADIGPARRDLGFQPSTPLALGIPRFVDWFRDYHRP